MSYLSHKLWAVVHDLIYFVSAITPKKKNIWVFGAWQGELYSDNSKYMYQHIVHNHKNIEAIWITKNKDVLTEMNDAGLKCYYYQSVKGIIASIRAKVVFTSSGLVDVAEWAHAKALHVSLWHGTPLKKIGYDNTAWRKIKPKKKLDSLKRYFFPYLFRKTNDDIYMVSSREVKRIYQTAFKTSDDNVFVTGQPRNDAFININNNTAISRIKESHPEAKIICYLPTHRNFGTKNNSPMTMEVMLKTDEYLRNRNIIMIFKPHFHEMKNFLDLEIKFTNIILGTGNEYSDVYSFLPLCDLLISDYSSVYVDYLCSNKPIVLFPYDLEDYIKTDAGLYRPYEDSAPGPVCYLWNEVLNAVCKELNNSSCRTDKYVKVQKLYNTYNDGNNCERVYKVVSKMVGIEN